MVGQERCRVCGKQADVRLKGSAAAYCEAHFRSIIVRRIRKECKQLPRGQNILLFDDRSLLVEVTEKALRLCCGKDKIIERTTNPADQYMVVPSCLELDASLLFSAFIGLKAPLLEGIRPLRSVSLEELAALCPDAQLPTIEEVAHPLLCALEKAQPGTFFATSSSLGSLMVENEKKRKE